MSYICGTDIGGTFTDCIIVDGQGGLNSAKAPSTPTDFSKGLFDAIELGAKRLGLGIEELLRDMIFLFHGTTVATNAIVQRKGCRAGLITTLGFRDIIHIMRGKGRTTGVSISELLHVPLSNKPEAIIPKGLIEEVSERVDCNGSVVVPLNEKEVSKAVDRLVGLGVEAIAIGFLWSFKNPEHEKKVEELIKRKAPDIFVTRSSEIAPKWGEYERITSAVINCYIGPLVANYLQSIDKKAESLGYKHPLLIMQSNGGVSNIARVSRLPALTFQCGPVAGVAASAYQGNQVGYKNIITTDMGGTTFDVGLIYEGKAATSSISTMGHYDFFVPSVNVSSIGSGGGSIIWVDEVSRTLKVGPLSAGAEPGPMCYGQGGEAPTVTDADLFLGFINPGYFLGGRIELDKAKAEDGIARLGRKLGMDPVEVANGSVRIVDYQMAELIRQVTIEKGHDPRDFVIFAYGGAGPTHAGGYAKELGVKQVVIPMSNVSSAWSAFGTAMSDIVHLYEANEILGEPFDVSIINENLAALHADGIKGLRKEGIPERDMDLAFSVDMRYRAQVHVVEIPLRGHHLDPDDISKVKKEFEELYQSIYGKGTGYSAAGFEMFCLRCRAIGHIKKPEPGSGALFDQAPVKEAFKTTRPVYWDESKEFVQTQIYDGLMLRAGNEIEGPTVVELPDTTILIHPGQRGRVDAYGNFIIQIE